MKPCIKCGNTDRYDPRHGLKVGACKTCAIARAKRQPRNNNDKTKASKAKWANENPEKMKAANARWYEKNSDKKKLYNAQWGEKNSKKRSEYKAIYRANNKENEKLSYKRWASSNIESLRIIWQNRRARKHANGGKLSKGLAAKLFILQKGICACGCKQSLGNDYHLDHRMPLFLGGSNTDDNVQLLTKRCNLQKGAKHPIDFMQSKGFLL